MSFHTLPGIIIATGLLASATASGVYTLNARRTLVNPDRMARSAKVSDAFTCSKAVHELANPRQHQATTDTRSITIDIPPHHRQVSDQVLLASFVKGFFGGLVFGPERVALQTLGPKLVNYPGKADLPLSDGY